MKSFVIAGLIVVAASMVATTARRGTRTVERTLGDLAVFRAPARLEPRTPQSTWLGTSMMLSRYVHFGWPGGSTTPTYEDLTVIQVEPRQVTRLDTKVFDVVTRPFERVGDRVWEAAATNGAVTRQIGAGIYRANTKEAPAWLVRGLDRERNLAVYYRVLQSRASRAQAAALVDSVLASYRVNVDLDSYFSALDRDLGPLRIAFPIELTDPFSMKADPSGAAWMFFRRHERWADDPELLEQTVAIAAFFEPWNESQAEAVRLLLDREGRTDLVPDASGAEATERGSLTIESVQHRSGSTVEPSWLVTGIDVARGVGVTYRVWQKDASEQEALAVAARALGSYTFHGNPSYFAPRPTS